MIDQMWNVKRKRGVKDNPQVSDLVIPFIDTGKARKVPGFGRKEHEFYF